MDKQLPTNQRDYIRMKVGDVLMLCMEDSSVIPIQKMVESLVMIGPESLDVLRDVLSEISLRRAQVRDDQQQVFQGFTTNMEGMGITLKSKPRMHTFFGIRPVHILNSLKKNGVQDEDIRNQCMQMLTDTRELMYDLRSKLDLLDKIEQYLVDWTWAILYMSSHQQSGRTHLQ